MKDADISVYEHIWGQLCSHVWTSVLFVSAVNSCPSSSRRTVCFLIRATILYRIKPSLRLCQCFHYLCSPHVRVKSTTRVKKTDLCFCNSNRMLSPITVAQLIKYISKNAAWLLSDSILWFDWCWNLSQADILCCCSI